MVPADAAAHRLLHANHAAILASAPDEKSLC